MSNKIKITILDARSGQFSVKDATKEELDSIRLSEAAQEAQLSEQEEKEKARESALAKLAKLGLTEEEIAAL
jgi:hypothetical protein